MRVKLFRRYLKKLFLNNILKKNLCQYAGTIDKSNERSFKCHKNYDQNLTIVDDINKYLCKNVLKREKSNRNELLIIMKIYS